MANALLSADDFNADEYRFPLDLVFCTGCSLVQITETVRPDILFSNYPYFSSVSHSFVEAAQALTERMMLAENLGSGSLVVEIASNDGYLLQGYARRGVPVLGIDPAANVADVAQQRGVPTRVAFFNDALASELVSQGTRADIVHANNVLAHVPDLVGTVSGIHRLLKPGGVAVIEVPYVREMVDRCEFDTIYHEHLSYFSATALARLFDRNGLVMSDVERTPFHGGTLRFFVRHVGATVSEAVAELLADEAKGGLTTLPYYANFARQVETLAATLRTVLSHLKSGGARLAAYGASAKGTTLLNYAGIGADHLEFVVDRSPAKQGWFTPGTRLPILAPDVLEDPARRPDYLLLLAWNFADEIIMQQKAYTDAGGRFIVPVPDIRIA